MNSKLLNAIPLTSLVGIGPKMAEKLAKIKIFTVQDLLFHIPFRYEDRTKLTPINNLVLGQYMTINGTVISNNTIFGRKQILTVKVKDETGTIILRFFNFNAAMKHNFSIGAQITAYGEIKRGRNSIEIIHPEYNIINNQDDINSKETLTPIYSSTEGLKQITLRKFIEQALKLLKKSPIRDLLPENLYPQQISLTNALETLHNPKKDISLDALLSGSHPAQKRLIIEELIAHNLAMLSLRTQNTAHQSFSLKPSLNLAPKLKQSLPFNLTNAQLNVITEIEQDLAKATPMMRLVQGDVGSGKTLVAAISALSAIENGYQVVLMVPTELLAEQHTSNFSQWFTPLNIKVDWLAGKLKGKKRGETLANIKDGSSQMIIGTHALFQDDVYFNNLALIIIDEQHRFGVHQRLSLREKGLKNGIYAHQLIMTATPIPRTLTMTAYADLDISIIDELPPGRTPIQTVVIPDAKRELIIERIKDVCLNSSRQVYWICTLIDESDILEAQAAEKTTAELSLLLPELKIGLVHGRMKSTEKNEIMTAFKRREIDLLVATTVIEVGVDVPNASLMIIENPERLGLAQLHQLRGRVGRGQIASHCVLLYHPPLSKTAQQRLSVMRTSNDGFIIAQKDLEIRGPGEVLGTKQTGMIEFKIADLIRDQLLIPQVQELAKLIHKKHPDIATAIIKRWLPLGDVYSQA